MHTTLVAEDQGVYACRALCWLVMLCTSLKVNGKALAGLVLNNYCTFYVVSSHHTWVPVFESASWYSFLINAHNYVWTYAIQAKGHTLLTSIRPKEENLPHLKYMHNLSCMYSDFLFVASSGHRISLRRDHLMYMVYNVRYMYNCICTLCHMFYISPINPAHEYHVS